MPSESHKKSEENKFGCGNKQCLEAKAICSPETSKMGDSSTTIYADCAERIHAHDMLSPDVRRTSWDYTQQFGPKVTERRSYDLLKDCIRTVDRSNVEREPCSEKPLDFSKKPMSSVSKDEFPGKFRKANLNSTITSQRSQENGGNSSDGIDDSRNDEEKYESFAAHTDMMEERLRAIFESRVYRQKLSNGVMASGARKNGFKRNGLKAGYSSGSEDELHPENSVNNSRRFQTIDQSNQPHNAWSKPWQEHSPPSYLDVSDVSRESNSHSENGFSLSKETNGFHIQDLLNQKSPQRALFGRLNGVLGSQSPKKHSEKGQEITNSMAQPSANHLVQEENLPTSTSPNDTANVPSRYTSPNHALNCPAPLTPSQAVSFTPGYAIASHPMPLRPSLGTIGGYAEVNGVLYPNRPTAFSTKPMSSFMGTGYLGEVPGYARSYPYSPGTGFPAAYNDIMYPQAYQQSLVAGQDQQKSKKTRPFKEIDTSMILQQIQMPPEILNLNSSTSPAYNPPIAESNGPAAENSSPLSPDSPTNVNSSPGNETTQQQDSNGEGGRKKGRRIPPEEKDERYLEKRRKNNIAAKKSRDERRKKEDTLAEGYKYLQRKNVYLEATSESLRVDLGRKEHKLEMLTARLISFREKCEGHTKEIFDETFKLYLPYSQ